jgi:hypothetical protein
VQTISRWIVPLRIGTTDYTALGRVDYITFKGGFTAALTSTGTPFTGVKLSVIPGRLPGVFLDNSGRDPVVVTGRRGEPFLRIGPAGTEANDRSPSWVDDQRNHGNTPTEEADASAPPDWHLVHPEPRILWLETRGFYPQEIPPTTIITASSPTVLLRWSVPLTQGATTVKLTATTSYVPDHTLPGTGGTAGTDDSTFPWVGLVMWVVLLGLACGGTGLWLRARRAAKAAPSRAAAAGGRRR